MMQTREQLQDRIAELEALLGIDDAVTERFAWMRIAPTKRKLLGLLMAMPIVSKQSAYDALYGGRPDADQPRDPKIIDTHLSYLRACLRQHGVVIELAPMRGWFLSPASKQRLLDLEAAQP